MTTIKGSRTGTRRLIAYCTASGIVYTDELTRSVLGEYVDHLRRGVSKQTASQYIAVAGVCFAWAVDRGHLSHNPFAGLARRSQKTTRRILTDDERQTIVAEAEHADLWMFMLGTGCRVIEVCRIEAEHVRIDSPMPHVIVHGKGDKQRTIPLARRRRVRHSVCSAMPTLRPQRSICTPTDEV